MLGPDQPVILHLLDIPPATQSLDGVKMELIDAALPLLQGARALPPPLQSRTCTLLELQLGLSWRCHVEQHARPGRCPFALPLCLHWALVEGCY